MRCAECGADLPGEETCLDRFHAVLAAELGNPEAFAAHGLFVMTYHAQHPSRVKPWLRAAYREWMREIFGRGRDWRVVLADNLRPGVVDRLKAVSIVEAAPDVGVPVAGEQSIAGIDPALPPGHVARVEAWARSVAEHRFLEG